MQTEYEEKVFKRAVLIVSAFAALPVPFLNSALTLAWNKKPGGV
jgi:hypothetical protein